MKSTTILLILSMFLLSSCATTQLICAGQCSLQGLVCAGTMNGTTNSSAHNFNTSQAIYGNRNASMTMCREPKNEKERERVSKIRYEAKNYVEKENSMFWPKMIGTFLGVILLGSMPGG